jgi:hypothetical protein
VEIIEADDRSGDDLVQIAFADTREEAALIRGLLREVGIRSLARQAGLEGGVGTSSLLTRSPRRGYLVAVAVLAIALAVFLFLR